MIVYFSGTGNSYYVAKSLLKEGEELVDAMTAGKAVSRGGRLGVVYPCYCGDMPPALIAFIKRSDIDKPDYTFAVCTCGLNEGRSFASLKYLLCEKGSTLDYAEKIVMPDSCVLFAFSQKKVGKLLGKQNEKIKNIKEKIANGERTEIKAKKPLGMRTKTVWFMFGRLMGIYKKYSLNTCNGCGTCVKYCKAGNIKIRDGKAVFGKSHKNCYECFACINACPQCAVRFGRLKNTEEKRYIHPVYKEKIK